MRSAKLVFIGVLLLGIITGAAVAASADYNIKSWSISPGGGERVSDNYRVQDAIGEAVAGYSESESYRQISGFFVPQAPECVAEATASEAWITRYNGLGNGDDSALAMAVDDSGNVYVTGYSNGNGTGEDYTTTKYDSNGNKVWDVSYNGPGNGYDWAHGIAVDGSGNVYVTGLSTGAGTGYDYATIKYDSNGNEQWVARYNSPGDGFDWALSIALDDFGNVYVTGMSQGIGGYDYATIKYTDYGSTFTEKWVAPYNGPANGSDAGFFVVVDGSGNVYVTGQSEGVDSGLDYATIKYDSDGNEVWSQPARYNGPGNGDDRPAVLPSYYAVYMTGCGMAVDDSGNVYVTGQSEGIDSGLDYATIKYDSNGIEVWDEAARYNGPGNGDDLALAIGVDSSGNVYVTGGSTGPGSGLDYATIKYDSDGNAVWDQPARYNGPGNGDDGGSDIALDSLGNVYVTGVSTGTGTGYDYTTMKYDGATGDALWYAEYNGTGNGDDLASTIAFGRGNVYVTGSSEGTSTGYDFATIKYVQGWTSCTPVGWDIVVTLPGDAAVEFSVVESAGYTTIFSTDQPPDNVPMPSDFLVVGQFANISTTADYSGPVKVCITYDDSQVSDEASLRLWHYDDTTSSWEDATTTIDTVDNIIGGQLDHLSVSAAGVPSAPPEGSSASGDGWFYPDANGGKSKFDFVVKYKKGSYTGNLEFKYKAADINLKGKAIKWMIINDTSVQFLGTGTNNGEGLYTFRVRAIDNADRGKGNDYFDIRIWEGTDLEPYPMYIAKNTLSGGDIVVHRK